MLLQTVALSAGLCTISSLPFGAHSDHSLTLDDVSRLGDGPRSVLIS